MSTDFKRIEEKLRSEIYAALVELDFARPEEKAEVVRRLHTASRKLHALIVDGQVLDD